MKKYLIGVSGGPDSMCLLDMYRKEVKMVCHVNYNKRKTAKRDEEIVKEYCKKYNIKLSVLSVSRKMYAKYMKVENNFQSIARKIRYDFFVECAKKQEVNTVLIAHNYDDFIETAYMSMKKESKNLLYGIKKRSKYKTIYISRPLLFKRKSSLLKYCIDNKINFGIDETNLEDGYERNRVRKELAKMSKEEFKVLVEKIKTYNLNNLKLQNEVNVEYAKWKKQKYLDSYFAQTNEKLRYYLIYNWLSENDVTNISSSKIEGVEEFIIKAKKGKSYRLNNELSIVKK
ncbi:MAG: tRNA lysidine(34) synthetase TilS [Mycoplasmataceae bacterium]|nr:tRNA lysidine(34) synthetase TilS [Mycoplasmataceae bacterium]